jgi:hypothetical protein
VDFLSEIFRHYGKSVRDEHLTIAQLRDKGRLAERKARAKKANAVLAARPSTGI